MIKMLVIDLDETLLNTDKTISLFSEDVLKIACSTGIKIVFATARPFRAIKHYLLQVQCAAIICHNGAITFLDGKRIGKGYGVPINEARQILTSLQNKYPYKKLSVEINDLIYANFDVVEFWGKTSKDREILNASTIQTDFSNLPDIDADKVLIEIDSENEYEETMTLLPPSLYGQFSDGRKLCLVMNRYATKLNAIKLLAYHWGISKSEIAAFGDDYNDIEMIEYCGIGVAMKNAIKEVLQVADVVTDTNNNDGVAKYILDQLL
jgi:Cof subfamily protein (haloacid dehalogenase superfamily)